MQSLCHKGEEVHAAAHSWTAHGAIDFNRGQGFASNGAANDAECRQ
jgi:hypothetical protein